MCLSTIRSTAGHVTCSNGISDGIQLILNDCFDQIFVFWFLSKLLRDEHTVLSDFSGARVYPGNPGNNSWMGIYHIRCVFGRLKESREPRGNSRDLRLKSNPSSGCHHFVYF